MGVLSGILSRKDLLVVTGYQGTLLRKEGKAPWSRLPVPEGRDLYGVVASPGGVFWAYGDKGTLLRSSDEGAHWSPVVLSPTPRFLSSVFFVDGRTGYAAGAQGALYRTIDGGGRWTSLSLPTRENLYAVLFLDASHGLVAGWHQTLLRTSDGGATWRPVTLSIQRVTRQKPSYNALSRADGTIYLAGDHGLLFFSTDAGASFSPIQTGSFRDLYGVCRTGDGKLAVAGEEGTLLLLDSNTRGGWTVHSPLGPFHGSDFLGLSCGATHVRLVGTRNVILLPSLH
ncbi:MAG: WD40/YVTN/BNR-like repeat-containing protein [Leptospirillia bacterium]